MEKCTRCGSDITMQVMVIISAPSYLEGKFSKKNLRNKDVKIMAVHWDKAKHICPICGIGV